MVVYGIWGSHYSISKRINGDLKVKLLKIFISIKILNFLLYNPVLSCSDGVSEHT